MKKYIWFIIVEILIGAVSFLALEFISKDHTTSSIFVMFGFIGSTYLNLRFNLQTDKEK